MQIDVKQLGLSLVGMIRNCIARTALLVRLQMLGQQNLALQAAHVQQISVAHLNARFGHWQR